MNYYNYRSCSICAPLHGKSIFCGRYNYRRRTIIANSIILVLVVNFLLHYNYINREVLRGYTLTVYNYNYRPLFASLFLCSMQLSVYCLKKLIV